MPDTKFASKGAVLTLDGVVIAQWRDGSESGGDREEADVTTHDTPGEEREYLSTFKSRTTYDFEVVWDPASASHSKLRTLAASGARVTGCSLMFPQIAAGFGFTFTAAVTRYGLPTTGVDGALIRPVSMTISNVQEVSPT